MVIITPAGRLVRRALAIFLTLGVLGSVFHTEAYSAELGLHQEVQASLRQLPPRVLSLRVDNVDIVVRGSSLPPGEFVQPAPDNANQMAELVAWEPFRELTITAAPFGHKPGTEELPAAARGGARGYEAALRSYRTRQGGRPQAGPSATIFGVSVNATRTSVRLYIDALNPVPVVIDEWVVEGGNRLWIVRASQEQAGVGAAAQTVNFDSGISIESTTLDNPSAAGNRSLSGSTQALAPSPTASAGDLPVPSWWNGDCDTVTYSAGAGEPAYRLGAVYLGIPACGPRPWFDGSRNVIVRFFSGAWGVLEWQCVELSMRFLYLVYGVSPYSGNGSQVVWNYSGSRLVKIANGTVGVAPQPNDVLSYGSTSTAGHTSVVTASSVDANGNGSISIIEENASPSGSNTLAVSSWRVSGNAGAVSGWLHDAAASSNNVNVMVGGALMGSYALTPSSSDRKDYSGVSDGPVRISSADGFSPIVASERVAYSPDGGSTWSGFSELMGLPANQLSSSYVMPWYNNAELNTQLRFGNVGSTSTTVTVKVGGVTQGSYVLAPNQSTRVSYAGLNSGPVQVTSSGSVPIIASERVAYSPDGGATWPSFNELMGMPSGQLTTSYVMPWYNNAELNTQLRFGNVGARDTTVTVTVGGAVQGSYLLAPSQSMRVSYPGLNSGPVVITSSGGIKIIASERVSYTPDGGTTWSNFSEVMGLPQASLSTTYWLPIYDNVNHNDQLRFGNVGTASTTVVVKIGGVVQDSYVLEPSQSMRVSYPGVNSGPVQVTSWGGALIIVSHRVSYSPDGGTTWPSFAESMALPSGRITSSYVMPWYNNADLDTQLRFAKP